MTTSSSSLRYNIVAVIIGGVAVLYGVLLWSNLSPYWFNPHWTTDDASQQIYPFHRVLHPELFKGDLITEAMVGYLAPIHYWLCYGITWLTGDPVMMGHWMMLIQIALTVIFLFLYVRKMAGMPAAFFAALWFLHTRPYIKTLTDGLPRGWIAPLLCMFLYFAAAHRHFTVLALIGVSTLIHPSAAFLMTICYFLLLAYDMMRHGGEKKKLVSFLCACPIYLALVTYAAHRPPEIGPMITYAEASKMPEFSATGRFNFLPFPAPLAEIKKVAFLTFVNRHFDPGAFLKANVDLCVLAIFVCAAYMGLRKRRMIWNKETMLLLLATMIAYSAARVFAFQLYVPNRYLLLPMGIFFIATLSAAVWRLFAGEESETPLKGALGLFLLGGFIAAGSGHGLYGSANFNRSLGHQGHVFSWLEKHTPSSALIAGQPTFIDMLQMFGKRTAYATYETAHPFYPVYYAEMKRRLEVSLRAHYARSLEEFEQILEKERIDYFVFDRKAFYPEALAKAGFFSPLDTFVRELASGDREDYAYAKLPRIVDVEKFPFMPFRDDKAVVIDVAKLKAYLETAQNAAP